MQNAVLSSIDAVFFPAHVPSESATPDPESAVRKTELTNEPQHH